MAANEFDFMEDEVHAIMAGTQLLRQDTFEPDANIAKNWYIVDLGDIHAVDESDGGSRTSWRIDLVVLVCLIGQGINVSTNALRSASNAMVADLMNRFTLARDNERVFGGESSDPYEVRIQDIKLMTPIGVVPDNANRGWVVMNGEIHYDRWQR